jgi:hypothetical protein
MGGDFYCRASGSAVFEVAKPNAELGIGLDALPEHIRNSSILTGNDLGLLGNSTSLPVVDTILYDDQLTQILRDNTTDQQTLYKALHTYAKELLDTGDVHKAWQVLLAGS